MRYNYYNTCSSFYKNAVKLSASYEVKRLEATPYRAPHHQYTRSWVRDRVVFPDNVVLSIVDIGTHQRSYAD